MSDVMRDLGTSEFGEPTSRSPEAQVRRAGFEIAGRTSQPARGGRDRGFPSVWVEAPPASEECGRVVLSSRPGGGWH